MRPTLLMIVYQNLRHQPIKHFHAVIQEYDWYDNFIERNNNNNIEKKNVAQGKW